MVLALVPAWRHQGVRLFEACRPRLIICVTCRAGPEVAEDGPTQGARRHAELERLIAPSRATASLELPEGASLANCEPGCSGAVTLPGKWTYPPGLLSPDHAADELIDGAAYAVSGNGTVLPSRRPASLRQVIVGRVPPTEFIS